MNPTLRSEASLPEFLAARARAASDARLVLDTIVGALIAIAAGVWRSIGWVTIAGVSFALALFGLWGIVDRELRERSQSASTTTLSLLRLVRGALAFLGLLSVGVALFAGLAVVLGTWIS
jgi:hypothetical protein